METSSSSLAKDINANPLSVYSQEGDILCASGNTNAIRLAGIMVAPKGDITLQNNVVFYGNIIGKTIGKGSQTAKYIEGHPITDLPNYDKNKDKIMTIKSEGESVKEEYTYVLTE